MACYLLGQKFYPIPYSLIKNLAYILITTLLVYGVNAFIIPNPWTAFAVHTLVIGFYLVIVYSLEKAYFRQPVT
jgi:hypothetical protein